MFFWATPRAAAWRGSGRPLPRTSVAPPAAPPAGTAPPPRPPGHSPCSRPTTCASTAPAAGLPPQTDHQYTVGLSTERRATILYTVAIPCCT
eukprot:8169149-Pyramimonas_sp.AAC.1